MDHVPYASADEAYITAGTLIALSTAVHELTNYDTKVAADARSRIACWTDSRHAFTTAAAAEEAGMAEIHRRVTVAEGRLAASPGRVRRAIEKRLWQARRREGVASDLQRAELDRAFGPDRYEHDYNGEQQLLNAARLYAKAESERWEMALYPGLASN